MSGRSGAGRTITVEVPIGGLPPFVPAPTASRLGSAGFATCPVLERRMTGNGASRRLEYHRTGVTVRVWVLSTTAQTIVPGTIGIATMTEEGYWELTSVMC